MEGETERFTLEALTLFFHRRIEAVFIEKCFPLTNSEERRPTRCSSMPQRRVMLYTK